MHKALREVIPKATVYRQLGDSYDEAFLVAVYRIELYEF